MKVGSKEMHFPVEVLKIVPGQKLQKPFMSMSQEQELIKKSVKSPAATIEAIQDQKHLANLFNNDQYLAAAQIRISPDLKTVKGAILSPPIIEYANGIEKTAIPN
uniref:Uncharacterized protein n=1 Tax=Panagrolaimus davidi TaxID=227884 RepID=A0A914PAQ9_9BILA